MAAKESKLTVFAHLGQDWAPCGQLLMTEEGPTVLASSFAYGLHYGRRADALEVDPVSLSLRNPEEVLGKRLLPANGLALFGSIRDAAPDAWGRRVIEAKLKVPANSLPESQYLLHAGSDRVGALDIRGSLHDGPTQGTRGSHALEYLMDAAERIEDGLPIPAHLEAIFVDGTALGGARPKASVRDEHGVLCLAKFSSRNDGFDIPAIECAALRLAAAAGLTVPPVEVRTLGARKLMLMSRFDRCWAEPGEEPGAEVDLMATRPGRGQAGQRGAVQARGLHRHGRQRRRPSAQPRLLLGTAPGRPAPEPRRRLDTGAAQLGFRRAQVSDLKLCAVRAFCLGSYPSQGDEICAD